MKPPLILNLGGRVDAGVEKMSAVIRDGEVVCDASPNIQELIRKDAEAHIKKTIRELQRVETGIMVSINKYGFGYESAQLAERLSKELLKDIKKARTRISA